MKRKWKLLYMGGFPKLGIPFLGVPMLRIMVSWGLHWFPLILRNCHITFFSTPLHTPFLGASLGCRGVLLQGKMPKTKDLSDLYGHHSHLFLANFMIMFILYHFNGRITYAIFHHMITRQQCLITQITSNLALIQPTTPMLYIA